ncbi:DoxX family protein [Bacteroidota bacterium]|nr:DoxX family protein [Bacteroidota bacterium]
MLRFLYVVVSFFVSILVTNVWLFRFNKETPYRGGDAINMIEEFAEYGLNTNIMYLVGFLKIVASIGLIIGLLKTKISIYSSLLMSILMIGAIYFHFKISDPAIKYFPSVLMLLCSIFIYFSSKKILNTN